MDELTTLIRKALDVRESPEYLAEIIDEYYWDQFRVSVLSDWERFELG